MRLAYQRIMETAYFLRGLSMNPNIPSVLQARCLEHAKKLEMAAVFVKGVFVND